MPTKKIFARKDLATPAALIGFSKEFSQIRDSVVVTNAGAMSLRQSPAPAIGPAYFLKLMQSYDRYILLVVN